MIFDFDLYYICMETSKYNIMIWISSEELGLITVHVLFIFTQVNCLHSVPWKPTQE